MATALNGSALSLPTKVSIHAPAAEAQRGVRINGTATRNSVSVSPTLREDVEAALNTDTAAGEKQYANLINAG